MFRLLKVLFFLAIIGGIGLVGFAYLGDMAPAVERITAPVTFDAR
jgi:hypothetical protein